MYVQRKLEGKIRRYLDFLEIVFACLKSGRDQADTMNPKVYPVYTL